MVGLSSSLDCGTPNDKYAVSTQKISGSSSSHSLQRQSLLMFDLPEQTESAQLISLSSVTINVSKGDSILRESRETSVIT